MLSEDDILMLGADVGPEEVRKALFSMRNYKAPGPDGFHPLFFKANWELFGPSIFRFVAQAFQTPSVLGDVNQTLLTLIPKVIDSRASDFRPIALCNVIYKIVTKVLANRIKILLPNIISPNQSSFISGRNTTDNCIILQEAVHSMNYMTGKQRFMIIKLDLVKAYDKMEWSFITESLELLHFPRHIVDLIRTCIATTSMSVNWQGRASQAFSPTRGLRQGDPMSPLLFVVALERLSHMISDAVNAGLWTPLKFGRGGPSLSHLMFANDVLLVAEASSSNVEQIMETLELFSVCSGQSVNRLKSCVFFSHNTPHSDAEMLSAKLGISIASDLGRYLEFPIILGRKEKADYSFLLEKIRSKLAGWKASTLSQVGRITLAQSYIMSVPNYVMQTSKIPAAVCDEVEQMCRDFIWGSTPDARKNHLISWHTICSPKEEGGLAFRSLRMVNSAYMMKLGWELITKREALWVQVLRFKYKCGNLQMPNVTCGSRASHIWRGLTQSWPMVDKGISWIIRNGQSLKFWQDQWVPGVGVLGDYTVSPIPDHYWHLTINNYTSNGEWDWSVISNFLPLIFV